MGAPPGPGWGGVRGGVCIFITKCIFCMPYHLAPPINAGHAYAPGLPCSPQVLNALHIPPAALLPLSTSAAANLSLGALRRCRAIVLFFNLVSTWLSVVMATPLWKQIADSSSSGAGQVGEAMAREARPGGEAAGEGQEEGGSRRAAAARDVSSSQRAMAVGSTAASHVPGSPGEQQAQRGTMAAALKLIHRGWQLLQGVSKWVELGFEARLMVALRWFWGLPLEEQQALGDDDDLDELYRYPENIKDWGASVVGTAGRQWLMLSMLWALSLTVAFVAYGEGEGG
jgi:hypothetical protein